MPNQKEAVRLDILMVELGLASARAKAQELIEAGEVVVDGEKATKASKKISRQATVTLSHDLFLYVGRGGIKLKKALEHFGICAQGKIALDVGACTGGFTDCLLQEGASKVYAVESGHGQLAEKLRKDPRVVNLEGWSIQKVGEAIAEMVDIVVMDVSFVSILEVIPYALRFLKTQGVILFLIKPQFELGKKALRKNGVVKSEEFYPPLLERIRLAVENLEISTCGIIESPIHGGEGNREFLFCGTKGK